METKVNLYKEVERSGNDVELVGKKLDLRSYRRSGICNWGIDIAAEFGIKSYDTGTKQKYRQALK